MDYLWSPWRYGYVTRSEPHNGCIFCVRGDREATAEADQQHFILHRGEHCFVILNLFPYAAGHLMVAPYDHVATLSEAAVEACEEMMRLTRRAEGELRRLYNAPGCNLGMNVGRCAGAGVAGHIHMHVLPRWPGDVNFMTAIGETRVLPEDLRTSYEKLRGIF